MSPRSTATTLFYGVRTFRPTDSSPHGRFAPCMDISPHGRFAIDVSPYGCGAKRQYTVPKTFRLTRILALFLLDAIFLAEEDNSVPCKEKYVPMCTARCNAHITLIALVEIPLKQSIDGQLLLIG